MMNTFLLLGRMWAYVHLQRYNSFVIFVYLNYIHVYIYIYVNVQVYLVIGLSFQCVVFLMFGRLCHLCVLCRLYVERLLNSVYFLWLKYVLYIGL
jgi:hypothetical protein